jgi:hypothetical protein
LDYNERIAWHDKHATQFFSTKNCAYLALVGVNWVISSKPVPAQKAPFSPVETLVEEGQLVQ